MWQISWKTCVSEVCVTHFDDVSYKQILPAPNYTVWWPKLLVVFHSGDLSGNWLALGNIHLVSHNSFNKIMK